MVLNGGEDTRPFAAAALVNAGWAPRVLVAETLPSPAVIDGIMPPYHEINRQVLLKRGVPAADVTILPGAAATTYDEARRWRHFSKIAPMLACWSSPTIATRAAAAGFLPACWPSEPGQVSFVSAPTDEFPHGLLVAEPVGFPGDCDRVSQARVLCRELRMSGLLAGGLRRADPGRKVRSAA